MCEQIEEELTLGDILARASVMSEPGRICEKCSGFVADEDAAIVGV